MSKKEIFIAEIENIIETMRKSTGDCPLSEDALIYFEALKAGGEGKDKKAFTENGKLILQFMRDNKETYRNLFTAKAMGEGIGVSSRTISGAIRKLVTDGYVEKLGENPISYSLTSSGEEVAIPAE